MAVDETKLNDFLGQFVQDLGVTVQAGTVVLGHRLGLYRAMAGAGPLHPAELAYLPGAFQLALASLKAEPRIAEAFRTGAGVGWHEQDQEVFDGCEMFFAPGYRANLVQSWIPALDGVEAKLRAGARSPTSAAATAPRPSSWQGVPQLDLHRVRLPPAVGRVGPQGRLGRRRLRPGPVRGRPGRRLRRGRPRPGGELQLLPRHGRPGRGGRPPNALSQQPTAVLGNQAGEARTRELTAAGGFTRFRRAAETPFNLVYEVRP